jgi:hypothetical protein
MSIVPLLSAQAGGAFGDTPQLIPNLGLWLKADAGVTLVGGAVDGWADQSGNGRDFSAPGATNRPAYSGTLNGLPVLTFDGTDDYLNGNAASLNLAQNVNGLTIIAVAKYGASAIQGLVSIGTGSVLGAGRSAIDVTATQWRLSGRRLDGDSFGSVAGGTTSAVPVIQSGVFRYSAGTAGVFINSVSQNDGAFQTAGATSNTASLRFVIGCVINLSSFLNGDIAEVIIYQRAISVEERNSVERYLSVKWGIAI